MLFRRILLITCLILLFSAWLRWSAADTPTVVINELMWMGSSAASTDEWIELRNLTDRAVDLAGWRLTKKSSGSEVAMVTIPSGKTIPAGGLFLISRNAATSSSSMLLRDPDLVDPKVSLVNTSLQIKIYDAAGQLVDTADDGSGNPLAGDYASAEKRFVSMERNRIPGNGVEGGAWHQAGRSVNFKPGATELGTPGAENSNGVPLAEAGSSVSGRVGEVIRFDGSDSTDPENDSLTYDWVFGDGQTGVGATPDHVYASAGTFEVVLRVSDGTDETSDKSTAQIIAAEKSTPLPNEPVSGTNASGVLSVTTIPEPCRNMQIVDIFPNPAGPDKDESITIRNSSTLERAIDGCLIVVGKQSFQPAATASVKAGATTLLKSAETHLRLVNSGATVEVVDAVTGAIVDRATYPKAVEGKHWVRSTEGWVWDPPDAEQEETVLVESQNGKNKAMRKSNALTIKVKDFVSLQQVETGAVVSFSAIVTSPVGLVGANLIAAISGETPGLLLMPKEGPMLAIGSRVAGLGTVRQRDGRRVIELDLKRIEYIAGEEIGSTVVSISNLGLADMGRLVRIEGVVMSVTGARFEVDDGSEILQVSIKNEANMIRPRMSVGDRVSVVGIIAVNAAGLKLYPRQAADVIVTMNDSGEKSIAAQNNNSPQPLPVSSPKQTIWYWMTAALAGAGIVARSGLRWWRERRSQLEVP